MTYYIEITKPDGELVAAEMESDEELSQGELAMRVADFAQEEGICPRWGVDHCKWKIKEG
jgi:hypothetical protein